MKLIVFILASLFFFDKSAYAYDISNEMYQGNPTVESVLFTAIFILSAYFLSKTEKSENRFSRDASPWITIIMSFIISGIITAFLTQDILLGEFFVIPTGIIASYIYLLASHKKWKQMNSLSEKSHNSPWILAFIGYSVVSVFISLPFFFIIKWFSSLENAKDMWWFIYFPLLFLLAYLRRSDKSETNEKYKIEEMPHKEGKPALGLTNNNGWETFENSSSYSKNNASGLWILAILILLIYLVFKDKKPEPYKVETLVENQTIQTAHQEPVKPDVQPKSIPINTKYVAVYNDCEEEIILTLATNDYNNFSTTRWWTIEPFSQLNTGLAINSSNIYAYAYSKSHTWKGDDKTGVIAKVKSNTDNSFLTANFYPIAMKTIENISFIGFTCERRMHQKNENKFAGNNQATRTIKLESQIDCSQDIVCLLAKYGKKIARHDYRQTPAITKRKILINNLCREEVIASIAFYDGEKWLTNGWHTLKPLSLSNTGLKAVSKDIYIYGKSHSYTWEDQTDKGFELPIKDEIFTSSSFKPISNEKVVKFLKVDVIEKQKKSELFNEIRLACPEVIDTHFSSIEAAHPDFDSIVKDPKFYKWMASQQKNTKLLYERISKEGNSNEVIAMLNDYKSYIKNQR